MLANGASKRKDFVLSYYDLSQTPPRERIWSLPAGWDDPIQKQAAETLASALGVTPLTARLLCNRGCSDPASAEIFFGNDERVWNDPMLMADMPHAVKRVLDAVKDHESIAIYGDYDVDGVTSVTSLYLYLTGLGADVTCYIPNRLGEGYGMSIAAVDQLADQGVSLIITVDTGITAHAEIAHAAALGVDTVVTDHHECHAEIPVCTAVVNPHRPDCPYPFKELAGVGVVFKLICACEATRLGLTPAEALEQIGSRLIDLVAIGTVADVMPLTNENRYIVARGLSMLEHTQRPGLSALLDAISGSGNGQSATAGAKKPRRKVNSGLVGFGIAPRINAAGRIAHAMMAVDLLLAETPEHAEEMAAELCAINTHRQAEENAIADRAYAKIERMLEKASSGGEKKPSVIVLEDNGWMQGVVGIVASRITEKYGLPSILISFEGAMDGKEDAYDLGKGSGRSIKGLNLVDALADSRDLLVRFGGHELAAGLTIRRKDIPAFRKKINEYAAGILTEEMTAVRYEADCECDVSELTMKQAEELERLEPFGVGNPSPGLILRDVVVQRMIPLGGGRHTKLMVCKDGQVLQAIRFGTSPTELRAGPGELVDLLFHLNINDYQGVKSLQLILQDVRPSQRLEMIRRREDERLAQVIAGAPISPSEELVPSREEIAAVFSILREEARQKKMVTAEQVLLEWGSQLSRTTINRTKLRLILRILSEMDVCHVTESSDGYVVFEVYFDAPKTSIDASSLMCRLRSQLTEGDD